MRHAAAVLFVSAALMLPVPQAAGADPVLRHLGFGNAMPGSFADLVQGLLPAVVNISSTQKGKAAKQDDDQDDGNGPGAQGGPRDGLPQLQFPPGSPFQDFFDQLMKRQEQNGGAPAQAPATSLGSGFIIDADKGYVITNNHVVEDSDDVKVTLHDDTVLPATVIGRDDKVDIAVLKVKTTKKLTAVQFGDSARSRIGDWVLAIGNPFGLGGTVTAGIVSAESRDIQAGPYDDFIQTDASINRGNSGGPMFNTAGEVIGINTAIFSPSGGSVGIGFAIPSNLAKPVIDQIIQFGHARRGWLGVKIQTVTDDLAENLKLPASHGALIASMTPGSPAEKAGLKPGDVILNFDGKDINAMRSLPLAVAEEQAGRTVRLTYWRAGKRGETSVTIGALEQAEKSGLLRDETKQSEAAQPVLPDSVRIAVAGLTLGRIDPDDRRAYGIADGLKGAVVTKVAPLSDAAEKGLSPGDVVVEADRRAVTDPAQVTAAFAEAAKDRRASVLLLVNRAGDVRFVALKAAAAK